MNNPIIFSITMIVFFVVIPIVLYVVLAKSYSSDRHWKYEKKVQDKKEKQKQKKLPDIYKRIKNHPYVYNYISEFITGAFGIGTSVFLLVYVSKETLSLSIMRIFFFLMWILFTSGIILIISAIKKSKPIRYKRSTSTYGNLMLGRIICYCKNRYHSDHITYYDFNFVIGYNDVDSGEEKYFLTPNLSFDPSTTIGSDQCSVYVYKDIAYACNFQTVQDTGKIANLRQDNSYLKNQKVNKVHIPYIEIIFATFAIFCILYYFKFNI